MAACDVDFDLGAAVIWQATFTDEDGVLANPSVVTFRVIPPDGVELTPVSTPSGFITNPSVGVFRFAQPTPLNQPGTWRARAAGTGGLIAVDEATIGVGRSVFV